MMDRLTGEALPHRNVINGGCERESILRTTFRPLTSHSEVFRIFSKGNNIAVPRVVHQCKTEKWNDKIMTNSIGRCGRDDQKLRHVIFHGKLCRCTRLTSDSTGHPPTKSFAVCADLPVVRVADGRDFVRWPGSLTNFCNTYCIVGRANSK